MKKIVSVLGLGLALTVGGMAVAQGDRGFGGHERGMGGPGLFQAIGMLSELNLSDEQKAQIKTIRQNARAEMKALRGDVEDRKAFRQQMKDLVQAESFDEDAFKALLVARQAKHAEGAVIMAKSKNAIWNLLNAEQQASVNEMLESRGPGKRGHRRHRGFHHGEHE